MVERVIGNDEVGSSILPSSTILHSVKRFVPPEQILKATHMSETPACPKCNSAYVYEDQSLFICPECAHEWPAAAGGAAAGDDAEKIVRDANGTPLQDGDTVTVIKDLKIKGSSDVVKVGTKVKGIRLVAGDHDIDCKVPGFGQMGLKSEFVKKVND